jgi:hypothetical protein
MSALSACISHKYRRRYISARERESSYIKSNKGSPVEYLGREKSIKDNLNNSGEVL